jgi:hypothetical protein
MKSLRVSHGRPAAEKWRKPKDHPDPEAPAFVEPTDSGHWALYIRCPLCGHLHKHGGGSMTGEPQYGHRGSHCFTQDSGGYWLTPAPPGMPKPKAKPYAERFRDLIEYDRRRGLIP